MVFLVLAGLLTGGGCSRMVRTVAEQPGRELPGTLELAFTAMEARRAAGLDPLPVSIAPLGILINDDTGNPVLEPHAWPGETPLDDVLVGAPGYFPAQVPAERLLEEVPIRLEPYQEPLYYIPYRHQEILPRDRAKGFVQLNTVRFLEEALERRGLSNRARSVQSRTMIPDGAVEIWPTDRWEELLALAGAVTPRLEMDPIVLDDAGAAFEFTQEGVDLVTAPLDGTLGDRSIYGTTVHIAGENGAARWTINDLAPGRWGIWMYWNVSAENSKQAQMAIYSHGSEVPNIVWTIDQSQGVSGFNRLGDWIQFSRQPIRVEVFSGDGKPVIADALLFEPVRYFSLEEISEYRLYGFSEEKEQEFIEKQSEEQE